MFHKKNWKLALMSGMTAFLLLVTGQQSFSLLPGRHSSALFAQTQGGTCPARHYWCLPSYRNPPWYSCWPEDEIGPDWHCSSGPALPPNGDSPSTATPTPTPTTLPGGGNPGGGNPVDGNAVGSNPSTATPTPTPTTLPGGGNPGDGNSGDGNPSTATPTPTPTTLPGGGNPGDGNAVDGNPSTATPTPAPTTLPNGVNPGGVNPDDGSGDRGSSSCIVLHAATPVQFCPMIDGYQSYFVGPDGTQVGPYLSSVRSLSTSYPVGSSVVTLFDGRNPLSGKPIVITYLPDLRKIRVSTYYADLPLAVNKPYILTIDANNSVTHLDW